MRIAVVGVGYVGLVTATCFAEMGNDVYCIDLNKKKIDQLRKGRIPFYEPQLQQMLNDNIKGKRLHFTNLYQQAIPNAEVIFICVGTPPQEDGSADIHYVLDAAKSIKPLLKDHSIVAVKSTVPVGTCDLVEKIINKGRRKKITVVSNPEFLKEGDAVRDFMYPDRVVVGTEDEKVKKIFYELYSPYTKRGQAIIFTKRSSSELIKYAANTYLAMRISFINEISMLCEKIGADVEEVRKGIGTDRRIGMQFLYPGVGYGGSCFPKDVKCMIDLEKKYNMDISIASVVDKINSMQKENFFKKITQRFGEDLKGFVFAIEGVSFKPNTDDIRESPALFVIERLIKSGARVRIYDPIALKNFKMSSNLYKSNTKRSIYLAKDFYDAASGTDGLILITEWNEFRRPDYDRLYRIMRKKIIFDGRNIYSKDVVISKGFEYFGIGLA